MNKLYLSSALLAIFALPAFADINKNASTATCDSSTIGATSGSAYMDTAWTANTINLQWYSNGEQIDVSGTDSATCTYDDVITLPSTPTVPTGYTFGGWRVRVSAAPSAFDLSTLSQYIETGGSDYYARGKDGEDDYCVARGENTVSDDEGTGVCTEDSGMSDVALNEWKAVFSYGTVRGEAVCANNGEESAVAGTPQGTGGKYCWCRATGFDAEKDGIYQNVASSSWIFNRDYSNADSCAFSCADYCADFVLGNDDFRRAVFGISE